MDNFLFQVETASSGRREHGSSDCVTQCVGPRLNSVENCSRAMHDLANAVPPEELSPDVFRFYEKFPPRFQKGSNPVDGIGEVTLCSRTHFENRKMTSSGWCGIATMDEHHPKNPLLESRKITCAVCAFTRT
jgi:hypothetical protein